MNTDNITVSFVLSKLEKKGIEQQSLTRNKEFEKVSAILAKLEKHAGKSGANILLREL